MSTTDAVGSAFANHMLFLSSRNVTAMISQFEGNATVTWTGQAVGLTGMYAGAATIGLLLNASFLTRQTSLAFANATQEIVAASDRSATVNSSFAFIGQSPIYGNFSGAVRAQDFFVYSAATGGWLISQENWNFLSFDVQYPVRGYVCTGPSCPSFVQAMAISEDGNFLAAGAYQNSGYGSVYLVSLQKQPQGMLWRSPTNTTIWSVAISSDGSYVAAGGFENPGVVHGHGEVYLFDKAGKLLWNFTAGSKPRMVSVAIAANGSRVAADYGSGMLYIDTDGHILFNQTFPQGGTSSNFAMSSDAKFISYTDENITMQSSNSSGIVSHDWGVFCLDSQGRQLWNHTVELLPGQPVHFSFVKMTSDGSRVAASLQTFYNGTVFYFDGRSGAILWQHPYFLTLGVADYTSLAMSPDGSNLAAGGPASGVMVFDSGGKILSGGGARGAGEPILVLEGNSLVLLQDLISGEAFLMGYNGTLVSTPGLHVGGTAFVAAATGSIWVAAEGMISSAGACATLHTFNGSTALTSVQLCQ